MKESIIIYGIAIVVQVLLAAGQISIKVLADRLRNLSIPQSSLTGFFFSLSLPAITVGLIYLTAAGLWVFVLKALPVSRAFPFVGLTFVFVPLLSYLVLGEQLSIGTIVGGLLIVAGVMITVFL